MPLHAAPNRTVVVTGASSGIGLAIARESARQGDRLVLAARGEEALAQAARQCEAFGVQVLAVPTDVTDAAQLHALAQAAVARFGGIDVWINDAGTSLWGPFAAIPAEQHEQLLRINLLGVIHGSHAALQQMLAMQPPRGVIINIASVAGRIPMPLAASYSASKFGVAGFTEALRDELGAGSGIAVCGVYPAFVDTPTHRRSANHTGHALRPVPPVLDPELVARAVVRLARSPQRSLRLGWQHLAGLPHALAPDAFGRLTARLATRYFLRSGPPASSGPGALFGPLDLPARVHGAWGLPQRRRAGALGWSALAVGLTALAWAAGRRAPKSRPSPGTRARIEAEANGGGAA